jgi:hypothetical protein
MFSQKRTKTKSEGNSNTIRVFFMYGCGSGFESRINRVGILGFIGVRYSNYWWRAGGRPDGSFMVLQKGKACGKRG